MSVLDPPRRGVALAVASDVATRASDPERIAEALAAAARQTRFPQTLRWEPYAVAGGDAGLALMCGYLDACVPGEGWDVTAHGFVTAAARSAERTHPLPAGLFGGTSGLALSVESLSRGGTRYRRLLGTVDDAVAGAASEMATGLRQPDRAMSVSEFDVISGASGIGAYLSRRDTRGVLPDLLRGLVSLADLNGGTPRWYTPPHLLGDESTVALYPWGNLNCGLAHGIPGPLALLSLALRDGQQVPGMVEAIRRLADWLLAHRVDDQWGVNWPVAVPLSADGTPVRDLAGVAPSRSAWCYGSPGVARALWLAGDAVDEPAYRDFAVEAMLAVLRRPVEWRHIDSPTFCHGVAGLLQVVLRFAHDTGLAAFRNGAADLVEQLLAGYEPDRPLGYASLEPGPNPVDRAGLLDGAPGVAMALLAAATDTEPTWDRLFLLS